jgi:hypothetical protein
MRQLILTAFIAILAFSCNSSGKNGNTKVDTAKNIVAKDTTKSPMPGSDRDEHGCIGSAGYTWSVIKNECIRIFEAGTRLNAAAAVADKTTSAFALLSTDNSRAELFLPGQASSLILKSGKSNAWTNDEWLLEKMDKGLVLKKAGIIQYAE